MPEKLKLEIFLLLFYVLKNLVKKVFLIKFSTDFFILQLIQREPKF
jgi:hypothetical protein